MLNIPVRGDGTIDEKERKVVEEIAVWMKANSESIYGTRPWKIFGEGPAQQAAAQLNAQGFNEGKGKPFTYEDIRFATKANVLYATAMGWPQDGTLVIKSLATQSPYHIAGIQRVELLGMNEPLSFEHSDQGLRVKLPQQNFNGPAHVFKIKV
jgi:alpha-L-fucosidase